MNDDLNFITNKKAKKEEKYNILEIINEEDKYNEDNKEMEYGRNKNNNNNLDYYLNNISGIENDVSNDNKVVINKPNQQAMVVSESQINDTDVSDSSDLKDKLSSIMNLIVLDPYRAKMEMEELISSL